MNESIASKLTKKVIFQRCVLAVMSIGYAIYSIINNDFFLYAKRGNSIHLHGIPAYFLELTLFFSALAFLLPLGHVYDKRSIRPNYEQLRRYASFVAWGLCGLGISFNIFHFASADNALTTTWLLHVAGWLAFGGITAQLGRMPPSYLRKDIKKDTKVKNVKTTEGVAYSAAFIIAAIATIFLAIGAFCFYKVPDEPFHPIVVIPLLIGSACGFWSYSVIARYKKQSEAG